MVSDDPSPAAPGRLEWVRRVVNTDDHYNRRDALADVATAMSWLADNGFVASPHEDVGDDLERLRRLRGVLRELTAANTDARTPSPAVTAAFNTAVEPHPFIVSLETDRGRVVASLSAAGSTLSGVIATLAGAVYEATLTGTWTRLKACSNPECRWLFYDTSRSRTGRWCSMAACGSPAKARSYRARRRSMSTPSNTDP